MTDQDFEQLWKEKRDVILQHSEEYQQIKRSYTSWNFMDYLLLIGGFIISEQFLSTLHISIVLRYLFSLLFMVIIWLGYRFLKTRLTSSTRTLEDVEKELKEKYRRQQR